MSQTRDEAGLLETVVADGRPLIIVAGAALAFAGGFAVFLGISGQFLPQDVSYLHMTADQLCRFDHCRIVDFMVHDRIAFGGSLIAVGSMYVWLALFPLRRGEGWAWYALLLTSLVGFGSFISYFGYGYLDTWHGLGTLLLLPIFVWGLVRSRSLLQPPRGLASLRAASPWAPHASRGPIGRGLMLVAAGAMSVGGAIVLLIGMTAVFVPQDLAFMGTTKAALNSINPHLVSLMAHDRAGFGGGVCTTGLTACFCLWFGRPSRNLWEVLTFAWLALAGCAIGVHFTIGYTTMSHVGPAIAGALLFGTGLVLARGPMLQGRWKAEDQLK